MSAMAGRRNYVAKSLRFLLVALVAGAFAGGAALQNAPTGAAADVPVPSTEPTATASPTPTASASPGPTASPTPTTVQPITVQPAPVVEPTPEQSASVTTSAPKPSAEAAAAEAEPLEVKGYVAGDGFVGKTLDAPLLISGGTAPYSATATQLPPGVTFDATNLRFVGTPTEEGYFHALVEVSDSSIPQQTASKDVSVTIREYYPPIVELFSYTGEFPDAVVGAEYNTGFNINTPGSFPYTLSLAAGELPAGLTLGHRELSGTPTAAGTYRFTVRAADAYTFTDRDFSITVRATAPLGIGYIVPPAVLGEPYSAKIASVTGGVAPYEFWWSTPRHSAGSLWWSDPGPEGLRIDHNGVLNGIPTSAGTFSVRVSFRDAGLVEREIFWTTVTVLATRPPVVEQPPAENPPAAPEAPVAAAPPASVTPAGSLASTTGTKLAATGLPSGSLNAILWLAAGLLVTGAALSAYLRRRPRGRSGA
ncbi:putative Ig domain-containing protein [Paenarthrobacter nitroguajacolicus]|uniref:putative Ig domain-containing protein n=1 Tax=Paenarthrobacter nitroguajacolicus TaxID=211146 RepID=UPI0040542219